MKSYLYIVGVLSALVLVKSEISLEMKKFSDECKKEVGLPESLGSINFDEPKQKCFDTCMLEKEGSIVDGKVVAEKAIEFVAKHSLGEATDATKTNINVCASQANEETIKCDVGGAFQKCMFNFFKRDLEAETKEVEQYSAECEKEIGVTRESLKALQEEDPKKWCIPACVMRKKGGIVDGKTVADKIIEMLSQDMYVEDNVSAKAAITECINKANKSKDECQVFMVLRNCLAEKHFFR